MITQRFALYMRNHDWFAVLIEIGVVIVGLMLAFQLDGWVEQRGEREKETEYIHRLIDDFEADAVAIQFAIDVASMRLRLADLLMEVSHDPAVALGRPVEFLGAINQAAYTYTPSLTSHTFEDLRSTGNMRLLLDQELKDAMYDYYGHDQAQRQYRPLQLATEHRHFELVAGVLSHAQEVFAQDTLGFFDPYGIDSIENAKTDLAQVGAAAKRFSERPDLIAWLPQVRHLQIEQMMVHDSRLSRGKTVLESLYRHTGGAGPENEGQ
jgi:hypothetical protein